MFPALIIAITGLALGWWLLRRIDLPVAPSSATTRSIPLERTLREFERFVAERGTRTNALGVSEGIAAMLAFYRDVRVDGYAPPDDDRLLFEWGTYDWGHGENFEVSITRMFHHVEDGDAVTWYLHATWRFEPEPESLRGDEWWRAPPFIAEFEERLLATEGYRRALELVPRDLEVTFHER